MKTPSTPLAVAAACAFSAVAALTVASPAFAQYPQQPVKIVVGYAAGGTTDILARSLAEQLAAELKQSVIVENKPGAAGNAAAAFVQQSAPDGYTLFMATVSSHGINPALYKKTLGYEPVTGFEPVSMVASIPLVLITNPKLPAKSVQELVALAKQKPGELNYASSGNGSPVHLAGAMFGQNAQLELVHVPYRGGALANTSVMAGETQLSFATLPAALPQVKAGRLRAMAVTTKDRSAQLPDVPAMRELPGFKGFEINTWNALLVPKGTPQPVIDTLNKAVGKVLSSPKLAQRFNQEGATPVGSSPKELARFVDAELNKWAGAVQQLNIKID
ncbi:tripartite tricarboxylate transporter substrate binding protein [Cupriavidus respiraculi]|uniref:Bug family tripartite tricarboxylate transporter substrate binding protein n=1 Tax=Cupriavidus respiraculi TaxID=195930 RepID=UPI001C978FF8|nr:tripartite tricarboxylate transporter substrate binding protein [Cupriavidus respiraculi]MBY4947478.1 tripartite tricarboxylate transporter substrate binding protein [Cupriavidus respiraculi]